MDPNQPKVIDNDRDEITVELDGKELRGWSYRDETERRVKMLAAREFCEGWFQASRSTADDRLERHMAYSVDLQRIIEDLCAGRAIREPETAARFHYDMAVAYRNRLVAAISEKDPADA